MFIRDFTIIFKNYLDSFQFNLSHQIKKKERKRKNGQMNNSKSCVVQNHKIDLSSRFWSSPEIWSQLSYISTLVRGIQSTIATTRKRENPLNTAQKIARESSTKQDEEATTEEVPRSIAIYTEKEITMWHFQCFRLDTSFLLVLPPKR